MTKINFLLQAPKKIVIFFIIVYQKTLSPDHGLFSFKYPYGYCRHYPSCSQYTKEVVEKFGVIKGLFLGVVRLLKCNPWSQPKIDPVNS